LVYEKPCRAQLLQFGRKEGYVQDQVELAEYGAEDGEASYDGRGDDGIASDADVEGPWHGIFSVGGWRHWGEAEISTVAGLGETVFGVAMRGVDCDAVSSLLEAYCGVDYEPFCAADAEVGVEEYDVFLGWRHLRYKVGMPERGRYIDGGRRRRELGVDATVLSLALPSDAAARAIETAGFDQWEVVFPARRVWLTEGWV
jgi:hypothetical protein